MKLNQRENLTIKNIGLYYDKFSFNLIKNMTKEEAKESYKTEIIKLAKNIKIEETTKPLNDMRNKMLKNFKNNQHKVFSIKAKLKTPMLIGIGLPSVDEIGFYWSRNYSSPIVPASSFKGAFRNYLESKNVEEINQIFGDGETRGTAIFLDAIPTGSYTVFQEIQTPHFGEYYQEKEAPNDVYNPTPLSFLSISEGVEFRFDIIIEDTINYARSTNAKEIIEKNINDFLEYYGLGAKTSMGYGRFKEIREN